MVENVFKVGFINSTQQFLDCALSVASKSNVNAVTALAGLDASIPVGKRMEQEGVEVIISRRGTAALLRKNLKIPVLSARISFHDVFLNIRDASLMGRTILLTSFVEEKIEGTALLQEVFNVTLIPGLFHDSSSLETAIIRGKEQGCEIVIGGGVSMPLARKHGLRGVELRTNEDAIRSALEDALSVARANREEQEKALRYRTIMDATSEGIVAMDKNGVITAFNRAALQFLGLPEQGIDQGFAQCFPGGHVREVLESGRPVLNKVERFGAELFVANYIPLQVGTEVVGEVITFRDIPDVVRAENEVRRSLVKRLVARHTIDDFIHQHPAMKAVAEKVRKFSGVHSTVLITGETGTGKEILAQSIHTLGPRRKGPFLSINCASIPDQLLESELFGYEEGAFTGSRRGGKAGLFELAHSGTIFLDEIGATSLSVQSRLLRVLEEREVMRIGGDRLIPVNVRVIAATNQDLCLEVQKGQFREDLYFRLDVLTIHIPPLRERIDDLPVLVQELIRRCARNSKAQGLTIPGDYLEKLMELRWPGNVRQLQNFIEKLVILCEDGFKSDIFEELYANLLRYSPVRQRETVQEESSPNPFSHHTSRDEETKSILRTLQESRFCKTTAAKKLGMSRTTLWRKLREMGMQHPFPHH
jgi:transcriptional regulator, propionate catabolism operon regulatory protein